MVLAGGLPVCRTINGHDDFAYTAHSDTHGYEENFPEDVYEKLREERGEDKSFGDVIDRLLGRRPLADFYGAWNADTATAARETIDAGGSRSDERLTNFVPNNAYRPWFRCLISLMFSLEGATDEIMKWLD